MSKEITIEQQFYGKLVVDKSEKDIIQIWNFQTNPEPEVVQVMKETIPALIEALQASTPEPNQPPS